MWLADYAARQGFRYSSEPDERWARAWEPYVTLRTPVRYEHQLESTGDHGSLTLARVIVEGGAATWLAIAQDEAVRGRAAASSDPMSALAEPPELVSMARRATRDPAFDAVFAAFAPTEEELALALSSGVRRLTLSWQTPVHFEVRPGGVIVAPVALGADPASLSWLVRAVRGLCGKAGPRT